MVLNSVKIRNFKAISDMEIGFKPGINLLIGDNGVGKTSVLEAITVGLSAYFGGVTGIRTRGISQKDIRFELPRLGDASSTKQFFSPTDILCSATIDGQLFTWDRTRKDERGNSKTVTHASVLTRTVQKTVNTSHEILPVISYQSTARIANFRRGDYAAHIKKLNDRRAGYIGCIDDALDSKAINAWCLKMEMAEFKQKKVIHEYELFKEAVLQFMTEMEESNVTPLLSYDTNEDELVYGTENGVYPVSCLSAGYQSILWIVMDLAYRNSILNPDMLSPKEINGVVLIDEIDMHLHPKWQWKVVPALQKTFPNIQFIIATHSPVIISSCQEAHIAVIGEDHNISYEESAYAYSIQQVIELIQGSKAVPALLSEMSAEFEDALNREDYDTAKNILSKMNDTFGPQNAEVQSAAFELSMEVGED